MSEYSNTDGSGEYVVDPFRNANRRADDPRDEGPTDCAPNTPYGDAQQKASSSLGNDAVYEGLLQRFQKRRYKLQQEIQQVRRVIELLGKHPEYEQLLELQKLVNSSPH